MHEKRYYAIISIGSIYFQFVKQNQDIIDKCVGEILLCWTGDVRK